MAEKIAAVLKRVTWASLYIGIYTLMQMVFAFVASCFMEDTSRAVGIILILSATATYLIYRVTFFMRAIPLKCEYVMAHPKFLDVLFAITLAIGFRVITSSYYYWSENIKILSDSIDAAPSYDRSSMTVLSVFLMCAAVIIIAPIFEEILFRGIVMTELSKAMPKLPAIVIQGILFGISHMSLFQGIFTAVFGIILGFVYYKTKKLSVTIIVHAVFNMSAVLELNRKFNIYIAAVLGIVIVTASIWMFIYLYGRNKRPGIQ